VREGGIDKGKKGNKNNNYDMVEKPAEIQTISTG
jgi:hypothetical protein